VDGIRVHRLPAWGKGPLAAGVFALSSFLHLVLRRNDYDVIHAHLASAHAVSAAAAGHLLDKRVVIKLAGGKGCGEIALSKRSLLGRLKLWSLGKLGPVLAAPNPDILTEIPGTPLEGLETAVVPNGVDLAAYSPATPSEKAALRSQLGLPEGFLLLSASRLDNDKGFADLFRQALDVWGRVARGKKAYVVVAGTGPAQSGLEAYAGRVGAPVVFLGPRHDMSRLYRASDAFLLPTRAEGLSNALLEAMACGLAVVATRVSGTVGLVLDGHNGLLYDPGDAGRLGEHLGRLLSDEGLTARLGRAARASAEGYSIDHTVDLWLAVYGAAPADRFC